MGGLGTGPVTGEKDKGKALTSYKKAMRTDLDVVQEGAEWKLDNR